MEDLLGSKTAIKVLNVLFDNPLQEFKEISLIESAKAGKGAASSLINRLIDEKFAVCKRAGKTKIVNLNILNESVLLLKAYFDNRRLKRLPKEAQASSELLKNKIKENISLMIIFGSYPAGTAAEESDIDILIVAENAGKIDEEKKKVEALFGKKINLHIFSKTEAYALKDALLANALFKGIIIYGYDMAFYLLRNSKKEILERMEYLISRCKSAFKNYADKDYKSVDYIIGNILEQLVFLILTEKNIQYASKKDAADLIKKLPEGKSIEKIKNMAGKQKIGQLEEFLIGLYASHLLGKNND